MSLLLYLIFNFIIYSFIGWVIEEMYSFVVKKTFKKEGFLIGPFKPMYGIAVTLLILYKEVWDIHGISFMILCFLIPTTVEYISGYVLKHIFNKVYWDYSNLKYNINGLVTLKFSLYWTLLSFIGVYYFQPILYNMYVNAQNFLEIFALISSLVFLLDFYVTVKKFFVSHA